MRQRRERSMANNTQLHAQLNSLKARWTMCMRCWDTSEHTESFEFIVNWLHPVVISLNESFLITQHAVDTSRKLWNHTQHKTSNFLIKSNNFIIPRKSIQPRDIEKSLHFLNQCVPLPLLCVRIDDRLRFADRMLKGKWWKTFSILELHAGSPDGSVLWTHTYVFYCSHNLHTGHITANSEIWFYSLKWCNTEANDTTYSSLNVTCIHWV